MLATLLARQMLTADASDLGLAPGHWPQTITAHDTDFRLVRLIYDEDYDVAYAQYRADNGRLLRVFND